MYEYSVFTFSELHHVKQLRTYSKAKVIELPLKAREFGMSKVLLKNFFEPIWVVDFDFSISPAESNMEA